MSSRILKRTVVGSLAALAAMGILTGLMLPLRSHLSIGTSALVLVVPVVLGVALGGLIAGLLSVISGFLIYLFFFIPPYLTADVGPAENWTALAVYAVITVPIATVVDKMITARAEATERGQRLRQMFEISGLLVADKPQEQLLATIVTALRDVVDAAQVSILLPHENRLRISAATGRSLTPAELRRVGIAPGQLAVLAEQAKPNEDPFLLPLVAGGRPVGLLAIFGAKITAQQREPLRLFAGQAALAIERTHLREQALRAERRLERGLLSVPLIGADAPLTVISRYQPGREHAQLGGDFFDVVHTSDGLTWVLIGDVAGHGPEEAVLGVYLRVGWRALVLSGHAPSEVLPALQELLLNERRHDETFATACMLVIDERAAGATAFLAGHPAPLLICDRRICQVELDAEPPLGIVDGVHWSGRPVDFGPALALLCFTDGLIEGFDGDARLGVDGLVKLLSVYPADMNPDELVDALIADVIARNGGPLADDVAVLHMCRRQ